eukprot:5396504-Prymnesium_polylepis.1
MSWLAERRNMVNTPVRCPTRVLVVANRAGGLDRAARSHHNLFGVRICRRKIEEEQEGVREAARDVEIEGARSPGGRSTGDGDGGRDAEEPRLVLLGVVDELHPFLRGEEKRERGEIRRFSAGEAPSRRGREWSWRTWVVKVGPTAPSEITKIGPIHGAMFWSAGWLTPPSLPLETSPVRRRLRTVRRFIAPSLIARMAAQLASAVL